MQKKLYLALKLNFKLNYSRSKNKIFYNKLIINNLESVSFLNNLLCNIKKLLQNYNEIRYNEYFQA